MTREEAIKKWIIPAIERTWNEKMCKKIIKALKQEPSGDAISRQATISEVCTMMFECFGADEEELDAIEVTINNMPSVTPTERTVNAIPSEDAISREAVIEWLKAKDIIKLSSQEEMARKELKAVPSVNPQDCISRKFMRDLGATCIAYRNDKQKLIPIISIDELPSVTPKPKIDLLDKIRAEIEELADADGYGDYQLGLSFGLRMAMEIIDRYKTESEG